MLNARSGASIAAFCLFLQAIGGAQAPPRQPAAARPPASETPVDRAIGAVYPSLVRIAVVSADFASGRELQREGFGSGTIIRADGYVVTNHHVAGRARRITVTLADRQEVPATLVGADPTTDLAVIKLQPSSPRTFPAAVFGDSSRLRRGDAVLAMGSPFALAQSVTSGIVSNPEMVMPPLAGSAVLQEGEDVGSIVRWIQHDAAIFPGNSGGPLVNRAGEIVGVNELVIGGGGGIASAIPSSLVKPVVEALIRDGRVRRSWLGIELQPRVSTVASPGALVSWVAAHSPASDAGLQAGDLLVGLDGVAVDARYAEELPPLNQRLMMLPIGKPASLAIRRGAAEQRISITPVERAPARLSMAELGQLGIVASDLSDLDARERRRASTDGVRVVSLRAGGAASDAKPPLAADDVITAAAGKPLKNVADFRAAIAAALAGSPRASMLIAFDRGREQRVTVLDLVAASPKEEPRREASKAWVPVTVQALTPALARELAVRARMGARVTSVLDTAVPLAVGDIILAIDGDPVRASAPGDDDVFAAAIRSHAIGSTVTLTVLHEGREGPVPILLAASPRLARELPRYTVAGFDFSIRDLADADRADPRRDDVRAGVIVEAVREGGWAALGHLADGDVILTIDGNAIAGFDGFIEAMTQVAAKRPASVVVQIRRGVRTMFLELKPAWPA